MQRFALVSQYKYIRLLEVNEEASVDKQRGTSNIFCHIASEEDNGTGDIVGLCIGCYQFVHLVIRSARLRPRRPRHVLFSIPTRFSTFDRSSLLMSVRIVPGRTALARMLYCPRATAVLCMSERMPAFVGV